MPASQAKTHTLNSPRTAGVDVGGVKKGFHAVLLEGLEVVATLQSTNAEEVAAWCREQEAMAVGVDAPCCWRAPGGSARVAERQLMREGIYCFSTPTEEEARNHPRGYYEWMLQGMTLHEALRRDFGLMSEEQALKNPVCFETFPQAVACVLAGRVVKAGVKRTIRRALLEEAGIQTASLRSMDLLDAALCAFTARQVIKGRFRIVGDSLSGCMILPVNPDFTQRQANPEMSLAQK
ncbi:MAG TPA: DUF429 domain-containing protein [Verrucomicrobiales bacterium]|nr:DUF429 domain-containing protein [Verrucomicrobiales bacterium]